MRIAFQVSKVYITIYVNNEKEKKFRSIHLLVAIGSYPELLLCVLKLFAE